MFKFAKSILNNNYIEIQNNFDGGHRPNVKSSRTMFKRFVSELFFVLLIPLYIIIVHAQFEIRSHELIKVITYIF
jgi:hypothetical protein